ncbi:MAG TPA: ribonuclease HIII [Methanoregulaceae archaeon]|nr:ribonuclease HIII [Methanoregulaceae archaeon]HQJ88100.1 ribonuclease HIII [Methanoregulaceae archaeon]
MNGPVDLGERARELRRRLADHGHPSSEPVPIRHGLQFRVGDGGVVRLYARRDGRVTVDGSQVRDPALRLLVQGSAAAAAGDSAAGLLGRWPQVGADESGKGDFFGPLVAAAVLVDAFEAAGLAARGVRDSKTVSDEEVARLAATVQDECATATEVLMPAEYNARYSECAARGQNLNDLLAGLHAAAIGRVASGSRVGVVVVDRFSATPRIEAALAACCPGVPVLTECGAEARTAVAAASCVARARFLEGLSALSEEVGVALPKGGSSPAVVRAGRRVVERAGPGALYRVAKVHFRTTARVWKG